MKLEPVYDWIDKQSWLDSAGKQVQQAVSGLYESGGSAALKVRDFLNGVWIGHPLHAALTDIPVGAWSLTLILDALEMTTGRKEYAAGADAALAVGIGGGVAAATAGLTDYQFVGGASRRVGLLHALLNTASLVLYLASFGFRRRKQRPAGWAFAFAGFSLSLASAYLGGHLAYAQKVGVDHAPEPEVSLPRTFTPVMAEADLPEGELRRVMLDTIPILLVRRGRRIYALAETCSHLGGPLSEGQLEGDSVVCPWHGSRFALEDGRLMQGPSTYNQPCFQTRVRQGQVEIRVEA